MAEWYILHTLTGKEEGVKTDVELLIDEKGLEDKIHRVLVPTENIIEMKEGKKKSKTKRFFPGYVLIKMEMNSKLRALLSNLANVTHFVTSSQSGQEQPVPLEPDEVDKILHRIEDEESERRIEVPFKEGDPVKIIDGPFKDFSGDIEEVNKERGKVKVMVSIFGRLTPVEVDFLQVKEKKT